MPLTAGTFRQLITPRVAEIVLALADERRRVATYFGVRDLPTTEEWIDQVARSDVPAESRPVPERDEATALVRQGVLGSLTPLASAARLAGVPVPATQSIIQVVGDLAGSGPGVGGTPVGEHRIRRCRSRRCPSGRGSHQRQRQWTLTCGASTRHGGPPRAHTRPSSFFDPSTRPASTRSSRRWPGR